MKRHLIMSIALCLAIMPAFPMNNNNNKKNDHSPLYTGILVVFGITAITIIYNMYKQGKRDGLLDLKRTPPHKNPAKSQPSLPVQDSPPAHTTPPSSPSSITEQPNLPASQTQPPSCTQKPSSPKTTPLSHSVNIPVPQNKSPLAQGSSTRTKRAYGPLPCENPF